MSSSTDSGRTCPSPILPTWQSLCKNNVTSHGNTSTSLRQGALKAHHPHHLQASSAIWTTGTCSMQDETARMSCIGKFRWSFLCSKCGVHSRLLKLVQIVSQGEVCVPLDGRCDVLGSSKEGRSLGSCDTGRLHCFLACVMFVQTLLLLPRIHSS